MKELVAPPRPSLKNRSVVQRDDIGEPRDFRHIAHVGFDYVDPIGCDAHPAGNSNAAVCDDTSTQVRMPIGYSRGATQEIGFDVHLNDASQPTSKTRLARKVSRKAAKNPEYVSYPAGFQHLAHIEDTHSNAKNFVAPKAVSDQTIRNMFYVVDRNIASSSSQSSAPNKTTALPRSSLNLEANRKAMLPPPQSAKQIVQSGFPYLPKALPRMLADHMDASHDTIDSNKHTKRSINNREPDESPRNETEDPYCVPKVNRELKKITPNRDRKEKQQMNTTEEENIRFLKESTALEDRVPLPTRRKLDASASIDSQDIPTPLTPFTPAFSFPEEVSQKIAYEKVVEGRDAPFIPVAPPRQRLAASVEQNKNSTVEKLNRTDNSRVLPTTRKNPTSQQQDGRSTASKFAKTLDPLEQTRIDDSDATVTDLTEMLKMPSEESSLKDEPTKCKPLLPSERIGQEVSSDSGRPVAPPTSGELKLAVQELDNILDGHPSSSTASSRQTSVVDTSLNDPHSGRHLSERKSSNGVESNEKISVKELTKILSASNAKILGVCGKDFKKTKPPGESMVKEGERQIGDNDKVTDEEQPLSTISKVQHIGVNMFGSYDERTIAEIIAQKKMRKAPPPPVPAMKKPTTRKLETDSKTPPLPESAVSEKKLQSDTTNCVGELRQVPDAPSNSHYENISVITQSESGQKIPQRNTARSSSVKVRTAQCEMSTDTENVEIKSGTLGSQNRQPKFSHVSANLSKSCEMLDVDNRLSQAGYRSRLPAKLDHQNESDDKQQFKVTTTETKHIPPRGDDASSAKQIKTAHSIDKDDIGTRRPAIENENDKKVDVNDAKLIESNINNDSSQLSSTAHKQPNDIGLSKLNDMQTRTKATSKTTQGSVNRWKTCEVVTVTDPQTISHKKNADGHPLRWRALVEDKKEKKVEVIVATINQQDNCNSTASKDVNDSSQNHEDINKVNNEAVGTASTQDTTRRSNTNSKPVMNNDNEEQLEPNKGKLKDGRTSSVSLTPFPIQSTDGKEGNDRKSTAMGSRRQRHSMIEHAKIDQPKLSKREHRYSECFETSDENGKAGASISKLTEVSSIATSSPSFKTTVEVGEDSGKRNKEGEKERGTPTTNAKVCLANNSKEQNEGVHSHATATMRSTTAEPAESSLTPSNGTEEVRNDAKQTSTNEPKPIPQQRLIVQQTAHKLACEDTKSVKQQLKTEQKPIPAPRRTIVHPSQEAVAPGMLRLSSTNVKAAELAPETLASSKRKLRETMDINKLSAEVTSDEQSKADASKLLPSPTEPLVNVPRTAVRNDWVLHF